MEALHNKYYITIIVLYFGGAQLSQIGHPEAFHKTTLMRPAEAR